MLPGWSEGREDALADLLGRDSMRVGAWIGAGGAALVLANLIFAALLGPDDFGSLTLVEALLSVGVGVSPLGHDTLAVRGELPATDRSLRLGVGPVVVGALLFCAGAYGFVHDQIGILILTGLLAGCVGGGMARYCAAFEQRAIRLDRAQMIDQSPLLLFLAAAAVCLLIGSDDLLFAAASISGGYAASGVVGVVLARTSGDGSAGRGEAQTAPGGDGAGRRTRWLKALTFLAISASGLLLGQIERFVIPRTLTLADLGTFGVAWTVAGSPYKLLSGGIGYALLPKLRTAEGREERSSLVRSEAALAAVLGGLGGLALLFLAPWVVDHLYGAKYPVDQSLVGAVVVLGASRVAYSVANSIIVGTGEGRTLTRFNVGSWLALGLAVVVAIGLARFGLVGILCGVSAGWLARTLLAVGLAPE